MFYPDMSTDMSTDTCMRISTSIAIRNYCPAVGSLPPPPPPALSLSFFLSFSLSLSPSLFLHAWRMLKMPNALEGVRRWSLLCGRRASPSRKPSPTAKVTAALQLRVSHRHRRRCGELCCTGISASSNKPTTAEVAFRMLNGLLRTGAEEMAESSAKFVVQDAG